MTPVVVEVCTDEGKTVFVCMHLRQFAESEDILVKILAQRVRIVPKIQAV